ncbi:nitrate- and nitrite sensing domain-containing protein [Kitasatospora azatica]|uniref:nitrate- and nitrite sensing domain-containing protein n=1 Tax=Kitasatospora azatica TaxID=58347 RepID=UPI00069171D2|nr:nitrate- and nitrite sensing domain-containing protein [Kitasatospora azatica]
MTPARHAARRTNQLVQWWMALAQWRNWRLPVKLAVVLLVPATLAVGLGVDQVQRQIALADSYTRVEQLVALRGGLTSLIGTLQAERALAAAQLGSGRVDATALRQQTTKVDAAEAALTAATRSASLTDASSVRYADAVKLLGGLAPLRGQVTSDGLAEAAAVNDYGVIINGLLDLDQALAGQFGASGLGGPATALYDLQVAQEQIRLQQVLLLAGYRHGLQDARSRDMLRDSETRLQDRIADFRIAASPAELRTYQQAVDSAAATARRNLVESATAQPQLPLPLSADAWNQTSDATAALVQNAITGLTAELRTTAAQLQDRTSNGSGEESVLLLAVLLLATAIGLVIGRHLLRSLAVLRLTALDVAANRLPAAIASLREGQVTEATIGDVAVHTTEELGQLARAFDAVHSQAVRLAAEQAKLRSDLKSTLVNVSRRSQGLVDRQLSLMEQLERHEEDPDQLASLFRLDHLATRMRRNNENLMILAGGALVRAASQSMPLGDVLRAAVSEIEHYQRVTLRPAPSADLIGYAARDLARLLAELLDNATAFSPPDAQVVVVSSQGLDGALRIDVCDRGIGMSPAELAGANERAADGTSVEVPASRQMGLFVIGRLADRHGFAVELSTDPGIQGLRASVLVPAALVRTDRAAQPERERPRPAPLAVRRVPGITAKPMAAAVGSTAAGLPRRVRGPAEPAAVDGALVDSRSTGPLHLVVPRSGAAAPGQPAPGGDSAPGRIHSGSSGEPPTRPDTARSPWFAPVDSGPAAEFGTVAALRRPARPTRPAPAPARAQDGDDPAGSWFSAPPRGERVATGTPAPGSDDRTGAGLPKRVARPRPAPERAEARAAGGEQPTRRAADRAATFLSSYQAGIRQAHSDEQENS